MMLLRIEVDFHSSGTSGSGLLVSWFEVDLAFQRATFVGVLNRGTAAMDLRVFGVSVHLLAAMREVASVADEVGGFVD